MNNQPDPHKLVFIRMVETRVSDKDIPEAKIIIPLYMCLNCEWEGFSSIAYDCNNPDISELTDLLK